MPVIIKLISLALLQWVMASAFAFNIRFFRTNTLAKLLGIILVLVVALGVPTMQASIFGPAKNRSEANWGLLFFLLEEITSMAIFFLGAYADRGRDR
jgi:sterol desaturase/sphingolipid hydroxylase (fatty acid hydroxylase superfamily)